VFSIIGVMRDARDELQLGLLPERTAIVVGALGVVNNASLPVPSFSGMVLIEPAGKVGFSRGDTPSPEILGRDGVFFPVARHPRRVPRITPKGRFFVYLERSPYQHSPDGRNKAPRGKHWNLIAESYPA
jgi:hypothetical protein